MDVTAKRAAERAMQVYETVEMHIDNVELMKALTGLGDSFVFLARLLAEEPAALD